MRAGLASDFAQTRLSATTGVTTLPREISTAQRQTLCRHCPNRNGKRGPCVLWAAVGS
jgi:hypothetical protein